MSFYLIFGPPRKSFHPDEPFVRLVTDGIWEINTLVDKRNFSDRQLNAHVQEKAKRLYFHGLQRASHDLISVFERFGRFAVNFCVKGY